MAFGFGGKQGMPGKPTSGKPTTKPFGKGGKMTKGC